MGRKGQLPGSLLQSDNGRNGCTLLTEKNRRGRGGRGGGDEGDRRTSYKAAITGVIHTARSKERPLSGRPDGGGLIRTSISAKISCK